MKSTTQQGKLLSQEQQKTKKPKKQTTTKNNSGEADSNIKSAYRIARTILGFGDIKVIPWSSESLTV